MAEKNILAYFKTPEEAEKISRKLQSLQVVDMSIDRFSAYPGGELNQPMNLLSGDMSLAGLTQNASITNPSAGVLAAASPAASGMSDGGEDGISGFDILLTVVIEESSFDQAMRVIQEAGGLV
ncbi:hypothetical protein [Paenibacillus crassostreae]|uniref:Uncharacterized protein n=1 Tax=Paenibacillus crassostreae TaxID=1763538 RepID=A0A167C205_9BACL|nr:hypothetical protein [Paenibacillus crassostreae]AOZ91742.1 hypothetical protein LPB68_05590 [Paenibacillus crassostreae]OAB72685.1 hypothetical protein PNBC_14660 [Paenibacillus crassostreae]